MSFLYVFTNSLIELCLFFLDFKTGENALLIPTFWVNYHFGPKIDFITNFVPKKENRFHFGPCH